MKTGLNHAVRVTVAALSIVLGLGGAAVADSAVLRQEESA